MRSASGRTSGSRVISAAARSRKNQENQMGPREPRPHRRHALRKLVPENRSAIRDLHCDSEVDQTSIGGGIHDRYPNCTVSIDTDPPSIPSTVNVTLSSLSPAPIT